MREYFIDALKKINLKYDEEFIDKSLKFLKLLLAYNSHTNITAIRDEKDIIEKHFIDSLLISNLLKKEDKKIIDIGTGAGFPGLMLALYHKDINFTLLDSITKKTNFLNLVKDEFQLTNVTIVNKRAEDFLKEDQREKFDVGLCRGVSNLSIILEYELPFLKVGGRFLPQKKIDTNEVEEASNALKILKSVIINEHIFSLPFSMEKRLIIEIIKNNSIDLKYPRKNGTIKKKPL